VKLIALAIMTLQPVAVDKTQLTFIHWFQHWQRQVWGIYTKTRKVALVMPIQRTEPII
jgi:hypothetical protein